MAEPDVALVGAAAVRAGDDQGERAAEAQLDRGHGEDATRDHVDGIAAGGRAAAMRVVPRASAAPAAPGARLRIPAVRRRLLTAVACARACVASNSPTNATGAGSALVSTRTSPGRACATSACTIVLSPGAQSAVRAGPATRDPGTTRVSGRSTIPVRPAASCTVATPSEAAAA